jgi:peptidoglycan/LPS O-acetylase OafA/YrhL
MPSLHFEIFPVLFGIIILNFAANDKIGISIENKILNYLGNISYGLYMYHPIGIVLALAITVSIDYITNWLLYPLSLAITIIIAGLSYRYFEAFFLKYKNNYSNIFSVNSTNGQIYYH